MYHESYVSSTSCIIHPPFNVSSVLSFYPSHVSPTSCIIHPTSHVSCISCIIHLMYYRFSCNVFLHLIYYQSCFIYVMYHPSHALSMHHSSLVSSISCIIHLCIICLMYYLCIIHLMHHPCIIHPNIPLEPTRHVFSIQSMDSQTFQACTLIWLSNMHSRMIVKHGLSDQTWTIRWLSYMYSQMIVKQVVSNDCQTWTLSQQSRHSTHEGKCWRACLVSQEEPEWEA